MKHKCEGYLFIVLILLSISSEVVAATTGDLPPWHRPGVATLESKPEKEMTEASNPGLESLRALDEAPAPIEQPPLPSFYRMSGIQAEERDEETEEEKTEYEQYRSADQAVRDAEALLRAGDDGQAQEVLQNAYAAAEVDSAKFILANRLGTYYFRIQNYALAAKFMAEAYEIQPDHASLIANLAAAYLSIGKTDQAIEKLEGINLSDIQNRNLLFSIFFNLSCAYSLKAELDTALENLVKAANIDPASTFTSLGDTQLDAIRDDPRFIQLKDALENFVLGNNP